MPIPVTRRQRSVSLKEVILTSELARTLKRITDALPGESPYLTAINGVILVRADQEKPPAHLLAKPALCVVAQGTKWTSFGDQRHRYGAGQALLVNVEMPSVGRVVQASADCPFLGVIIELDPYRVKATLESLAAPPGDTAAAGNGSSVALATGSAATTATGAVVTAIDSGPLAQCILRLVQLLETPQAIRLLAPMALSELYYWLLTGPHGAHILNITLERGHLDRIIRAIQQLRTRFAEPIRIADLANAAGLSLSTFHRQFKAVTAMSPLQYQKQIRLLEGRRLMVSERANVETAAYATGYESPSQFSREYRRMFGQSPKRDARVTHTGILQPTLPALEG